MTAAATILLIDDDKDLCETIGNLLTSHGFNTLFSYDSKNIETILKENVIDLILLDIILPGSQDGIALCKLIRQITSAPIIMLTGIEEDVEKIVSLEMGADNYLTKPFNARVLLAHINAALRRNYNTSNEEAPPLVEMEYQIYEFLGWRLNVTARILLSPDNVVVKLTSAEFILLQAFVKHPQCVLSRDQLLNFINSDSESFDRSVDILISRLRSKIEETPKNPTMIKTMRNAGYMLACCVNKNVIDSKSWQKCMEQSEAPAI